MERITLNDRYRLNDRPVGSGGMGDIHTGIDLRLGRTVVVKLLRLPGDGSDEDRIRRFEREARLTAQLDHPGVPAVYDVGLYDGRPYLVMQQIRGIDISDLNAEEAPLPIGWVAAIGAQVSSVLMAAHAMGLIHRDIKPANLMLDRSGSVKVLDFGLAGSLDRTDLSRITRTGEILGTPAYMAPEQIEAAVSTPQTDLYALGCTLYDLLTGQPPFSAPTSHALLNMHLKEQPERLSRLRPEIPPGLADLVHTMMEKQPADRPENALVAYSSLVPFVADLQDLPSVSLPGVDPVRAYLVLGGQLPTAGHLTADSHTNPSLDRAGLEGKRLKIEDMLAEGRLEDAVSALTTLVKQATEALGRTDDYVIQIRKIFAEVLDETGHYRTAAREFRTLAQDLSELHGPDDVRVFDSRLHAAHAHLSLGEISRARTQLTELLEDQIRFYGDDHPAVIDLREELARLT